MEVDFESIGQNRLPLGAQDHLAGSQPPARSVAGLGGTARRCLASCPLPTGSPYALIVRRYLSLLDAAVELEFRDYSGPRLDPRYRVLMFEHALTADEANRKYRSVAGAGGVPRRGGLPRRGKSTAGSTVCWAPCCLSLAGGLCGITCDMGSVALFWQDPSEDGAGVKASM